ncbi:MAG: hypothetical protein JXB47_09355 [Anaerolineae bacterium]|nr:hypothetical protein [Anaerolineae bacterium]
MSEPKKPNAVSSAIRDFTSRLGVLGELMQFLWARKLWWLIPMFVVLGLFILVIVFGQASGAAPFIYTLF